MNYFILFLPVLLSVSCKNNEKAPASASQTEQEEILPPKRTGAVTDSAQTVYHTYCNGHYGYCIDYPEQLLIPQPEAGNGDGRIFNNPEGEEVVRIYGRLNTDPDIGIVTLPVQMEDDIADFLNDKNGGAAISYRKSGEKFYVFSGKKNGMILYQKTIRTTDGDLAFVIFRYPEKDQAKYDIMVSHMAASFH